MKEVVAAIIINFGKALIAQRGKDQKLAGKWEFPGGKIESGETPEECLVREIKEELGVDIKVDAFFAENTYQYNTEAIKLLAYKAKWVDGEYKLTVHNQIKWVKSFELEAYDFAPADIPIVQKLKEELK